MHFEYSSLKAIRDIIMKALNTSNTKNGSRETSVGIARSWKTEGSEYESR
jgi:hypothetical protein